MIIRFARVAMGFCNRNDEFRTYLDEWINQNHTLGSPSSIFPEMEGGGDDSFSVPRGVPYGVVSSSSASPTLTFLVTFVRSRFDAHGEISGLGAEALRIRTRKPLGSSDLDEDRLRFRID